jgi:PIN domain nuclease of toxin-antitoxin system
LRLLLDTHIAFRVIAAADLLSRNEVKLLADEDSRLFISAVSIWELRIKWDKLHKSGDRKGPIDPQDALQGFRDIGLPIIPLDAEIAACSLQIPMLHRDPFDELLLVHAQELEMRLFTRDGKLKGHPLALFA